MDILADWDAKKNEVIVYVIHNTLVKIANKSPSSKSYLSWS